MLAFQNIAITEDNREQQEKTPKKKHLIDVSKRIVVTQVEFGNLRIRGKPFSLMTQHNFCG